jgi:hypothetical protein
MSRRAVARGPGRGQVAAMQNTKEVDPRLIAVADWLRNEKKSGLITKEAVQYEKVRREPWQSAPHKCSALTLGAAISPGLSHAR